MANRRRRLAQVRKERRLLHIGQAGKARQGTPNSARPDAIDRSAEKPGLSRFGWALYQLHSQGGSNEGRSRTASGRAENRSCLSRGNRAWLMQHKETWGTSLALLLTMICVRITRTAPASCLFGFNALFDLHVANYSAAPDSSMRPYIDIVYHIVPCLTCQPTQNSYSKQFRTLILGDTPALPPAKPPSASRSGA